MKTIYLVRHGESIINTDREIYQSADAPLTELGRQQTDYVAKRASRLSFDALIASPMVRAKETVELIAKETGHEIEYQDVFREWHTPTSIDGKSRNDPQVHELAMRAIGARNKGENKVEDSENFHELSARASDALQFLQDHPAQTIVVVGHGYFTKMMIARTLYAHKLSPDIFEPLIWGMRTQNTGISVLQYDPEDRHRPWWLLVFNDHGHLG